jgi:hypothetical protein
VQNIGDCCVLCQVDQNCYAWATKVRDFKPPIFCWLKIRGSLGEVDPVGSSVAHVSGIVSRYAPIAPTRFSVSEPADKVGSAGSLRQCLDRRGPIGTLSYIRQG